MRKFLFFVMAAVLFCGCDKEEGGDNLPCPVTEVSVPASSEENPVSPGSSVTIQGQGFTANSEIWLRAMTRAVDVQAEVTDVTATTVTFTAPEVSGEQNILLKQDGGEWILGVLHFPEVPNTPGGDEEEPAILPKKLVKLISTDHSYNEISIQEYLYDNQDRLVRIIETDAYENVITYDFEYRPNQIVLTTNNLSSVFDLENGCVVSYECAEYDYGKTSTTFLYDTHGFLIGFVEQFEATDDEKEKYTGTISFQNNSMLEYNSCDTYGYEYSLNFVADETVPNNLNLDLMGFKYVVEEIEEASVGDSYMLGIAGNRSKYLPAQLVQTDSDGESHGVKYEYEKTDEEYISKIFLYINENDTSLSSSPDYTIQLFYEE